MANIGCSFLELRFWLSVTCLWHTLVAVLRFLDWWKYGLGKQEHALPIPASYRHPSFMHVLPRLRRSGLDARHGTV